MHARGACARGMREGHARGALAHGGGEGRGGAHPTFTPEAVAAVGVAGWQVLYLSRGTRFSIRFGDAERQLTWLGLRTTLGFEMTAAGGGGRPPADDDPDTRQLLDGQVSIEMLAAIGPRPAPVRGVARRAGMAASGTLQLSFATRIRAPLLPRPPREFRLRERTPYDFTVTWKPPAATVAVDGGGGGSGEAPDVTHYQIEIATTAPSGTYYPWRVLWCGAGHACPDPRLVVAQRTGAKELVERLSREQEQEQLGEAASKPGQSSAIPRTAGRKEGAGAPMLTTAPPEPAFSYSLPIDAALFGKLRIRCWARGEERPSGSTAINLPRWNGAPDIHIKLQMVIDERATYFRRLTQHVSEGLDPVAHRIGNPASPNTWGGDRPPPPPPPTAKEKAMGVVMAPVPYDVPRLPQSLPGADAAGEALAHFYRECGVYGGGGGELFGLRIDLVLHAIAGTPTLDGESSPGRTVSRPKPPQPPQAPAALHPSAYPPTPPIHPPHPSTHPTHALMESCHQ